MHINDWELESKINKVEKLRQQVRHNDRCMEIYNDLKELNANDRLYGWMFSSDDILDEDLVDFAKSYQKPYVLAVLQVYANELENILIKSELQENKMNKERLFDIIDNLLVDCANETIYDENINELSDEELQLIYDNVELFTLKLKDKIRDEYYD